jgi:hypothetical protein
VAWQRENLRWSLRMSSQWLSCCVDLCAVPSQFARPFVCVCICMCANYLSSQLLDTDVSLAISLLHAVRADPKANFMCTALTAKSVELRPGTEHVVPHRLRQPGPQFPLLSLSTHLPVSMRQILAAITLSTTLT